MHSSLIIIKDLCEKYGDLNLDKLILFKNDEDIVIENFYHLRLLSDDIFFKYTNLITYSKNIVITEEIKNNINKHDENALYLVDLLRILSHNIEVFHKVRENGSFVQSDFILYNNVRKICMRIKELNLFNSLSYMLEFYQGNTYEQQQV